jgi:predicted RecA/RadA family phage recombinase
MAEATKYQDDDCVMDYTPTAAVTGGEVVQLADGRAAVLPVDLASGAKGAAETEGIWTVAKTASVVIVQGQPVYWDHSANSATYAPASDRDFFLGFAYDDAASADTTMKVVLNKRPQYKIDINRGQLEDATVTAIVLTAGTVGAARIGGSNRLTFSATAEAQKADILSKQGFALGSNWIVEGGFTVVDDGDATAIDFNIGVANATHASDADSITESCFIHLDGNTLDLFAESDDGTTEVAATDTTVNIALGTPVHFVIDGRDPADIQIYVNGVLMLGATTFVLSAATGPLKLLAHLEKSSDDTTAEYYVDYLRVRTMQEDAQV